MFEKIPENHGVTFRSSNIDCCRYVKRVALLLYQLANLRLPNYNSHSILCAAVSQPDMNELLSTNVPLMSVNELQTDDFTTAGRITERVVWLCSSVIIQQQYIRILCASKRQKKVKFILQQTLKSQRQPTPSTRWVV